MGDVFTHDITATGRGLRGCGPPGGGRHGTGRCLVLVTDDAERTMATHLGRGQLLRPRRRRRGAAASDQDHLPRGLPLRPRAGQGGHARGDRHRPTARTARWRCRCRTRSASSDTARLPRAARPATSTCSSPTRTRPRRSSRSRASPQALDALDETGVLAVVTRGARGCDRGDARRSLRRRPRPRLRRWWTPTARATSSPPGSSTG